MFVRGIRDAAPRQRTRSSHHNHHCIAMSAAYSPLPTSDPLYADGQSARRKKAAKKNLLLKLIIAIAVMFTLVSGARTLSRSTFWKVCHGGQRNISTGNLPSHYTLPSGDKIPSVALGTVNIGLLVHPSE